MYKIMSFLFFKWSLKSIILCCGLITEHPYLSNNFIYEYTLPAPHKLSFSCCSSQLRKKSCFKQKLKMTLIGNLSHFSQCRFAADLVCVLLVGWMDEEAG